MAVGDYLDYGRNPAIWDREKTAQVTRILRSAERQFYSPPNYTWSFLRLLLSLDITAADDDVDLPDGFGGFFDSYLSFVLADNKYAQVRQTSVPEILRMRQNENLVPAIQPLYFAVNAKTPTGTAGQLFEVMLFPTPAQDGTLVGTYYANSDATTDSLPYANGGAVHAETLLACCLAAAELEKTKQQGPLAAKYQERLAASIQHDRRCGPKHLGYNGDRSVSTASIYDLRQSSITRNGVAISGW